MRTRIHLTAADLGRIRFLPGPESLLQAIRLGDLASGPRPGQGVPPAWVIEDLRCWRAAASDPHWHVIRAHARRDEAARSEQLGRHGWEHVLARLHSSISWAAPVLDYTTSPAHHAAPCGPRDLYLDGRGLGLVPSVFARATALWVPPGDATPLLRYPVRPALHLPASITGVRDFALDRLAALLGATRAAVLEKIAEGRLTTTELACALRISASSASEHTTVLRCGGLVRSHRDRNRVYHEITRTGRGLVDAVLAGAA